MKTLAFNFFMVRHTKFPLYSQAELPKSTYCYTSNLGIVRQVLHLSIEYNSGGTLYLLD